MTNEERGRYFTALWRRFGQSYSPGEPICDQWTRLVAEGTWIGPPVDAPYLTDDGRYLIQAFASDVLCWDRVTNQVRRGLPIPDGDQASIPPAGAVVSGEEEK